MTRDEAMQIADKLIKVLESCESKDQRFMAIEYASRALVYLRHFNLVYLVADDCYKFNIAKKGQGFIRY